MPASCTDYPAHLRTSTLKIESIIAFENFPLNCKEQAVMFCVTTYSAVMEGESIIYTQSRLSMFSVDPVKVYIQGVPVSVFLCRVLPSFCLILD